MVAFKSYEKLSPLVLRLHLTFLYLLASLELQAAKSNGAVCLDGSPAAYYFLRGEVFGRAGSLCHIVS